MQFELIPVKMDSCPKVLEECALPPTDEVTRRRNYHYAPCPRDILNPALSIPYLHSFFAPGGVHLKDFWVQRTPKKLHTRIRDQPHPSGQPAVIGWGVRIDERLNWRAWSVLAQLLIVLTLLFALVYAAVARDVSAAFAMAQYAVAALTMLNALHIAVLLQQAC
jgi:hypothetical protein